MLEAARPSKEREGGGGLGAFSPLIIIGSTMHAGRQSSTGKKAASKLTVFLQLFAHIIERTIYLAPPTFSAGSTHFLT